MGLSVCYDLRFPELYRALMSPPCDLIAVPSAFTATTGQAQMTSAARGRGNPNPVRGVFFPSGGGTPAGGL